jgi:hypothetical protein
MEGKWTAVVFFYKGKSIEGLCVQVRRKEPKMIGFAKEKEEEQDEKIT